MAMEVAVRAPCAVSVGVKAAEEMAVTLVGVITAVRDYEIYEGSYEVVPMTTRQILPATQKYLEENVVIYQIPTREQENEAGGVTFIIGG